MTLPMREGICPEHGYVPFEPDPHMPTRMKIAFEEHEPIIPSKFRLVCGCTWQWTKAEDGAGAIPAAP